MVSRAGRGAETAIVRRDRRIGNWGRASEHIGGRWEELGLERLRPLLEGARGWPANGYHTAGWVALAGDPGMQLTLNRVGLPSPDVIVGLANGNGTRVLQAVDMKWHLEFASYRQISADTLHELIDRAVPSLNEQVEASIGPVGEGTDYVDGLLLAPDSPTNRDFLVSRENAGQEYPIESGDVIFETVDGREFFSPLPGWEMALLLSRFDRGSAALHHIEGAERYYRLGAGLQGAAASLLSSIFVQTPPPVDADRAFAWLQGTFRVTSTGFLAQEVDRRMAARSQMVNRLKELMRTPFRLGDLAQTLRRHGLAMPQNIDDDSPAAFKAKDLLKQVSLLHKEAVRSAGLDLVGQGATDAEALATLAREAAHFQRLARANAERLLPSIFADM
ncbi:MAG: hypothetical protein ACYC3S_14610 [Chloroflexota bacterium]